MVTMLKYESTICVLPLFVHIHLYIYVYIYIYISIKLSWGVGEVGCGVRVLGLGCPGTALGYSSGARSFKSRLNKTGNCCEKELNGSQVNSSGPRQPVSCFCDCSNRLVLK